MRRGARSQTFLIVLLTVVITALLYVTQLEREAEFFYHLDIIFLELYFIPVVLACLWKGLRGGLATSLGVTLMLLPYLILNWEGLSAADFNRMLRIAVYFVGSVILGKVIAGQKRDQERAKEAESLAAIGKSMAVVAHDMKTPLVSIGGFSRLVLRRLDADFPHRDKLEIVIQETARLDSMVRDMLAFSKPLELNLTREDIGKFVQETLAVAEAVASKRGVTLRYDLSDKLRPVPLDSMRMKQALLNLVTNAIEASPEGETVTVKACIKKRNLQIEVRDCGCGIPLEKRQEIFLPFFTTKKDGVGLGLDITKKIVESHGGSIEILDNKRKGLVFKITMPA